MSTTYETSKPCRNGHTSPRYVSTGKCVECRRAGAKRYKETPGGKRAQEVTYQRHRDAYISRATADAPRRVERNKAYVRAEKDKPCMDCGVKYHYAVMEFDHRPGEEKRKGVSQLMHRSLRVLKAEIDKCDLVCANCHRIRTAARQGWYDPLFD